MMRKSYAHQGALSAGAASDKTGVDPWFTACEVCDDHDVSLPDLLVGLAWFGGGLAAWPRRETRGSAALMAWVGVTWLLGDAFQTLVLLHWGALAHLLIAYPTGRLESRAARAAVLIGYVAPVLAVVLPGTGWAFGFAIALPAATLVRFTTANRTVRRSRAAPLAVAVAVGGVLSAATVMSVDLVPAYELTLGIAALALAVDLRVAQSSVAAITGIVVDLGGRPAGGIVRERLARAIGDPSLIVGYVVEEGGPPVDEHGLPITLPEPGAGRVLTPVQHNGHEVAALVHDSASLGDPKLLAEAASALSITVANARLQAGLRSLMDEIAASTERLVDAGRAQQRRLAAELKAQVVPPLGEAGQSLQNAGAGDLHLRLTTLRRELMRLAEGLDPVRSPHGRPCCRPACARRWRRPAGDAHAGGSTISAGDRDLRLVRVLGGDRERAQARPSLAAVDPRRAARGRSPGRGRRRRRGRRRTCSAGRGCAASPSASQRAAGSLRSTAARAGAPFSAPISSKERVYEPATPALRSSARRRSGHGGDHAARRPTPAVLGARRTLRRPVGVRARRHACRRESLASWWGCAARIDARAVCWLRSRRSGWSPSGTTRALSGRSCSPAAS